MCVLFTRRLFFCWDLRFKKDHVCARNFDQDPNASRVLLSFMHMGKVRAAVLTQDVLLQAQFLDMDGLLEGVRFVARRVLYGYW